jgi:tripartite-type tricarboxylate transporter receptor subunit TctC
MKAIAVFMGIMLAWTPQAIAQDGVSFKDKQITMLIGSAPGGGTDASGRLIARFIGEALPGKPHVIVQNMPGAGGITALNHLVTRTQPDGMTVIMGSNTMMDPIVYRGNKNVQYDPKTLEIIGGIGRGGTFFFISKEAKPRLYDKKAEPVMIGNVGATPRAAMQPALWGIEYLGWNAKWVTGYHTTQELMLAFDRGEIDMSATGTTPQIADRVKSGNMIIVNQTGSVENGKIVGREEFGDAPIFPLQMREKKLSTVSRKALDYWFALSNLDKWLGLAPHTPKNILAAYRQAFDKMRADKAFIEQGEKMSDGFEPNTAADVESFIHTLADTTPETLEYMRSLMRKQGIRVK